MPPTLPFPNHIDFPPVTPGTSVSNTGAGLPHHKGPVTVRIDHDVSKVMSISSLDLLELTRDPDVPHSPLVWETVLTQQGSGPITLSEGQALAITATLSCPANLDQEHFSGVAVVESNDPAHTQLFSISMQGQVSGGSISLESTSAPPIAPGTRVNFTFRLESSLHGPVSGALLIDHASSPAFQADVSDPAFPTLAGGSSLDLIVPVICAAGTAAGNYPARFRFRAIDGSQEYASVAVNIKVDEVAQSRSVSVTMNLSPEVTLEHGSSTLWEIKAKADGGPGVFSIQPGPLPPGITLDHGSQSHPIDDTVFMGVTIDVGQPAQGKQSPPLTLNWSIAGDESHAPAAGTVSVNVTVIPVEVVLSPASGEIKSGNVQATGIEFKAASNGNWIFLAKLHDFSTVFGDNFALGFAFNFTNADSHAFAASGELGASATRPPETARVGMQGTDPWISQNWQKAFPSGGVFKLHTAGNVGQAFSDLGDDFKNALGVVGSLFRGRDCPRNPSNGEPQCPDPTTVEVPI